MTLQIEKDNAVKAYNKADKSVKVVLEELFGKQNLVSQKITERVKTFENACEVLGISPESVYSSSDALDEIAYKKLKKIIEALNEGWKPNWKDSNEPKYRPWFDMSGSGLVYLGYGYSYAHANVGSRLCFKTRELCDYAAVQFIDLYSDFFIIK